MNMRNLATEGRSRLWRIRLGHTRRFRADRARPAGHSRLLFHFILLGAVMNLASACTAADSTPGIPLYTKAGISALPCSGLPLAYSSRAGLIAVTCDDGKVVIVDRGGRVVRTIDEAFLLNLAGLIDDDRGFVGYGFVKTDTGEATLRRVNFGTGQVAELPIRAAGWIGDIISVEFDTAANCAMVAMKLAGDSDYEISVVNLTLDGREGGFDLDRPAITTRAGENEVSSVGNYLDGSSRCDRSNDGHPLLLLTRVNANAPDRAPFELHRIDDSGHDAILLRSDDQYVVSARRAEQGRGIVLRKPPVARLGIIQPDGAPVRWMEGSSTVQWVDFDAGAGTGFGVRPRDGMFELIHAKCGDGDCAETVIDRPVQISAQPAGAAVSGAGQMVLYTRIGAGENEVEQLMIRWTEEE